MLTRNTLSDTSSGIGVDVMVEMTIEVTSDIAMCRLDFLPGPMNLPDKKGLWLEEMC